MSLEEKNNKIALIFGSFLTVVLLFLFAIILLVSNSDSKSAIKANINSNGEQVVELVAKNGYTPKISSIEANKPAILRVNTNGTFDCSSSISIPKLSINKTLPTSGTTDIDIPAMVSGSIINGTCSMGMYSFQILVN
ncbi:MAG: cupredoxin domain-containing protein [bacterium]